MKCRSFDIGGARASTFVDLIAQTQRQRECHHLPCPPPPLCANTLA